MRQSVPYFVKVNATIQQQFKNKYEILPIHPEHFVHITLTKVKKNNKMAMMRQYVRHSM